MPTALLVPTHRAPTTPGEMIREEWLVPLNITQQTLADMLGITRSRLAEILNGKRSITVDSAMRLAKVLGTDAQFWLNLQLVHDLYHAQKSPTAKTIAKLKPLAVSQAEMACV